MNDAEVLYAVACRLFDESVEKFRSAHANSLESENALTVDKQLALFGEAIEQEKQAIATRAEAIENQKQAFRIWRMQVNRLTTDSQQTHN